MRDATQLQGDVIAILDGSGKVVVQYMYDAWGKLLSTTTDPNCNVAAALGTHNPLRYRGYVYDQETGLYYVSSRYYDPEIGRWISPESNVYNGEFDEGAGLIGYNVYAYCANNLKRTKLYCDKNYDESRLHSGIILWS